MSKIKNALDAFRQGKFVIVMDDYHRENEGDLICGAQTMTEEQMIFLLNHTTGIVCVAMKADRLCELELPMMVKNNKDPNKTAFTVSVDLRQKTSTNITTGMSTGVSAHDRTLTIRSLTDRKKYAAEDFSRPGHIFPLRYTEGGLFVRRGHTEAAVDLCHLAGIYPAGVLCELQNGDGTMSRLQECLVLSERHHIPIVSIQDIVDHMTVMTTTLGTPGAPSMQREFVRQVAETDIHLDRGVELGLVKIKIYQALSTGVEHVVLIKGVISKGGKCLVRVHSECITGDLFGSLQCDCGKQLDEVYKLLSNVDYGIIIYLRDHEGRGIGLKEKIKAYALQSSQGVDTLEANKILGHKEDSRSYAVAEAILRNLGANEITLLTNNPEKISALRPLIRDVVGLHVAPNKHNARYIETKQKKCGHGTILSKL